MNRLLALAAVAMLAGCQSAEDKRLAMFAQQVEDNAAKKRGWSDDDVKAFCRLTGFEEQEVFGSSAVNVQFKKFLRGEPVDKVPKDYTGVILAHALLSGSK